MSSVLQSTKVAIITSMLLSLAIVRKFVIKTILVLTNFFPLKCMK